ncbi:MAG TPA: orotidine-5'-phosphate decarboxylase [Gemmatimonadales bacterium]|nr:orotidine-5'-phosphate decarboxylase [Gemmatimonadales bacterium]
MAELILALDLPTPEAAFRLLDGVPDARWVKVGPILFTRQGPALVRQLRARGLSVFLDLKWHDIPNTVAGAVEAAVEEGVELVTVHTLGGLAMMTAAARAAAGRLAIVGVTVLTSHDREGFEGVLGRPIDDLQVEVVRLAGAASASGLQGVVCSPHEIRVVRGALPPRAWVVVPGIRRMEDSAGDQVRTAGPGAAAAAGATHLVVGRPILQAADPGAVFRAMAREAEGT